jgi:hypothetical protein
MRDFPGAREEFIRRQHFADETEVFGLLRVNLLTHQEEIAPTIGSPFVRSDTL